MKHIKFFLILGISLSIGFSSFSQPRFLSLKIIEASNYNNIIGALNFNYETNRFVISVSETNVEEADFNRAIVRFLNILEPQKSYIIQHDVSYYFVFQYNKNDNNYLVLNNTIGEKNEPVYRNAFREAKAEILILLQTLYNQTSKFKDSEILMPTPTNNPIIKPQNNQI